MLKLVRKLLTLAILCSALIFVSTSDVKVKAGDTGSAAACFAACDRELEACNQWGSQCPYANHMEFYPSQDFWFSIWPITCVDYYYGACQDAQQNCSIQCGGN